jgi:hypothetical protein
MLYNAIKLTYDCDKIKLKVMVTANLINYTLHHVGKLWIVNILRKYFSIYP